LGSQTEVRRLVTVAPWTFVRAAVADHLGRAPSRAELTAARRAAHSLATLGRARVLHVPGADAEANAGDRNYLVMAKHDVIMNDIRLRGLAVAAEGFNRVIKQNKRIGFGNRNMINYQRRILSHIAVTRPQRTAA
jgi:hypothetical protein